MIGNVVERLRPPRPEPAHISAVGRKAMISTSHPVATEAGLAALRRGGTAVDAYVAAAAVQTVVEPVMTSLAGGFAVTVYEPATGASRIVGGAGHLPAAEEGRLDQQARWSGRTVVPPGWVHGAHAAWKTWGKLDWADVLGDALDCAREGFVIDQLLWGSMFEHRRVAGRYQPGREVWFPDGRMASVGQVLRQPALARTLQQLAELGPDFFYRGEFAQRYVQTAQEAGGRITLDDMAACEDAAAEAARLPALPTVNGYELHTSGGMYALALNLAAIGKLGSRGRPPEDAETLFLLMRIVEESWHHCLAFVNRNVWGLEVTGEMVDAVSVAAAEELWPLVEAGPPRPFDSMNLNTNAIVVVDESGMIAHGAHSASSTPFGVGLMVDGVIVPRPIYHFADPVTPTPMGWAASLLALKDGRPVLAAGSPSISAVQNVLQNTLNILEWEMEPGASVQQPLFGAAVYPSKHPMVEVTMGEPVLEEVERRGLGVTRVSPWEPEMGSCHAVHIGDDGALRGAADPRRLGRVAGI